jgi:hypothetical protein
VVYQRAGEIWMLESLAAEPVRLDIRLSETGSGRAPYPVSAKSQLGSFALDAAGRTLSAEVRGTVHWLPDQDEPARTLLAKPGVRGRLPVVIPARTPSPARQTTAAKTAWTSSPLMAWPRGGSATASSAGSWSLRWRRTGTWPRSPAPMVGC